MATRNRQRYALWALISLIVTIGLIAVLDMRLPLGTVKTPRLGAFLSPQLGFWQNAEPATKKFNLDLRCAVLQGKCEVVLDERLVPHVFAENEHDLYFVQGWLHARFRLWQMEFQTHAAAGRLSEVMGAHYGGVDFLSIDRMFRRLGMVWAAEHSLAEMEKNPVTKMECDAYTAGVNEYISRLRPADLPLEYKLLDYKPEPWSNLKSALFLKYMSYDLAGHENDFAATRARDLLSRDVFEQLYPYGQDSLDPVIRTEQPLPSLARPQPPPGADSLYLRFGDSVMKAGSNATVFEPEQPDPRNGSNSWAVAGLLTRSGRPILCNDPHLSLKLPSIWYEMQLTCPAFSAYGASFPGTPSIIIGFNQYCAFGFTNSERDVRDYYQVRFRDSTMKEYWLDSSWRRAQERTEVIRVRGGAADTQHIALTEFGPVMYDGRYPDPSGTGKTYACRWKGHEATNELMTFNLLDRARSFADYKQAIGYFRCPGQNMTFANRDGDIALRQQGDFPAKWRRQGDFIMPGADRSYDWQGSIPDTANVIMLNPSRGFVSSANQYPYDTSYPYYLGGSYPPYRGISINRQLALMSGITPGDMQRLQTDNSNVFAGMAMPILLKYLQRDSLPPHALRFADILASWNLRNDPGQQGPSVFTPWWDSLSRFMYSDELGAGKPNDPHLVWPSASTLLEGLLRDSSAYRFADDVNTPQKETLAELVTRAFRSCVPVFQEAAMNGRLAWGLFRKINIPHLLEIPAFSRREMPGSGGTHVINAISGSHGPSWRMVVELTDRPNAFGIYPGGQNGNPGSRWYDNFVGDWTANKYYPLRLLDRAEAGAVPGANGLMRFSKS